MKERKGTLDCIRSWHYNIFLARKSEIWLVEIWSTKVNPPRKKKKKREGRPFQNNWFMPCSWISSSMKREWDVHAATVAWARGSRTDLHLLWIFFFAMTNLPPQLVALSRENKEHSLSEGGDSRSHPKQRNKKLEDDFVEFVF